MAMSITLSWDLFIILFFAIVTVYSFIIGKNRSMKVIMAAYIAIIATQGIGNVLVRLTGNAPALMQVVGVAFNVTILAVIKIFLFALFIILFAIKSGIEVTDNRENGSTLSIIFTALFGFSTAGLIVSTILGYATMSGDATAAHALAQSVNPVLEQSVLMQVLIVNHDIWFTLPAFLILAAGFAHRE